MAVQTTTLTSNGIEVNGTLPLAAQDRNTLKVIDNRTGKEYIIPIKRNSIAATAFKQMKTPDADPDAPTDQREYGLRVFDPGFQNTAVSESKLAYNDGMKGHLSYRGYEIGQLIAKKDFLDVQFLLMWGHLPSAKERYLWHHKLSCVKLDQNVLDVVRTFPASSPPVAMIVGGMSALQASQRECTPAYMAREMYLDNPELVDNQCAMLLSNMAKITAAAHCHHTGRTMNEPNPKMGYAENMLWMMNHVDAATGKPNPKYVKMVEKLWVLIAEHEMTCSTAALLQTSSSLPDAISAMISAVSAFYGILHGGALEVAYKTIAEVGGVEGAQAKIDRVKRKEERLFGYGHRIYRVTDPRAIFIKEMLDDLTEEVANDDLLQVAFAVDKLAQNDEYFTSRGLKPNADLYATFVYKAMGFPSDMIFPMTTMARVQGLVAHWKEAMNSGTARIWRPQQIYTGDIGLNVE